MDRSIAVPRAVSLLLRELRAGRDLVANGHTILYRDVWDAYLCRTVPGTATDGAQGGALVDAFDSYSRPIRVMG